MNLTCMVGLTRRRTKKKILPDTAIFTGPSQSPAGAGVWTTRDIDTIIAPPGQTLFSVNANKIIINEEGKYIFLISHFTRQTRYTRCRLYDVTLGQDADVGQCAYAHTASNRVPYASFFSIFNYTVLEENLPTQLEVLQYSQSGGLFGINAGGPPTSYIQIEASRVAS